MLADGFDSRLCALIHDPVVCRFVPMGSHDDYDYGRTLARHWSGDYTLVNVEHDMEYSDDLARELLACPHPLCTHAYQMHIPRDYWAHSTRPLGEGGWIDEGAEWAAYSGIGFCKIVPEARGAAIGPAHWRGGVEMEINAAVNRPWHVHWPGVEHHHHPDTQVRRLPRVMGGRVVEVDGPPIRETR